MFRLLHFSDSHLGFQAYGMVERLLDFAAALDQVADTAIRLKVDAVVDTGDTFHSPDPDPYSVAAYRRFVDRLKAAGIPFIGCIGNHNLHRVGQLAGHPTWMEAVSDGIIRPKPPEEPIVLQNRAGDDQLQFVVADWMPSEKVDDFLARITPTPIDAIFMHQSCEGFMPVIARSEVKSAQFDGLARYVGIGDIHVTKSQQTPKGTLIGSPGSTELVSLGECLQKYVVLVEFPTDRRGDISWEPIPIETRTIMNFPLASSVESLKLNMSTVKDAGRRGLPDSKNQPLIIQPYGRSIEREALAAKRELSDLGYSMLRFTPIADADSMGEFIEQAQKEQSNDMDTILSELLSRDPQTTFLVPIAQDLWKNPNNATTIIDALLESIRNDVTAPAPAPAAA